MTLFLAALQQIPRELYEAAVLDRASRWSTLAAVTLPSIRRTVLLVVLIEMILQFQVFGQILLTAGGGPNNASRPVVQFVYEARFRDWQLGFAAASSQVLAALWVAPVAWIVGLSFKPNKELMRSTGGLLAPPFTLKNYRDVLGASSVFAWMLNSAIVAVGQTVLTLCAFAVPEQAIIVPLHTCRPSNPCSPSSPSSRCASTWRTSPPSAGRFRTRRGVSSASRT